MICNDPGNERKGWETRLRKDKAGVSSGVQGGGTSGQSLQSLCFGVMTWVTHLKIQFPRWQVRVCASCLPSGQSTSIVCSIHMTAKWTCTSQGKSEVLGQKSDEWVPASARHQKPIAVNSHITHLGILTAWYLVGLQETLNLPHVLLPLLPALEAQLLPPSLPSHSTSLLPISTQFTYFVRIGFTFLFLRVVLVYLFPQRPVEFMTQNGTQ